LLPPSPPIPVSFLSVLFLYGFRHAPLVGPLLSSLFPFYTLFPDLPASAAYLFYLFSFPFIRFVRKTQQVSCLFQLLSIPSSSRTRFYAQDYPIFLYFFPLSRIISDSYVFTFCPQHSVVLSKREVVKPFAPLRSSSLPFPPPDLTRLDHFRLFFVAILLAPFSLCFCPPA